MSARSSRGRDLPASLICGIATIALCLGGGDAFAADLDVLVFGSLDAAASTFASAGAKVAPGSLARAGPAAILTVGEGTTVERFACGCGVLRTVPVRSLAASAVFGHQWFLPAGVLAAFAGFETTAEARPFRQASGVRSGGRLHAEAWLQPTEPTLVQATVIAGTARGSVWARLAWGYRIGWGYLGPEGSGYADASGHWKGAFGLHLTDFALSALHLRVSAGLQWEAGRPGPSPYVALATWAPL
ncbi:cellulose biosynthesis protein BcsS [Methylobacterium sp. J-076]|uniref:cellulose biosynthesis protein BcsS n=1 Tax=Methylobacterium sp. J-076 TaxID=2836655 RepID=UPI001FBB0A73|nr:cellulose biosynthesis protein BcsS [Methylobacterium sp. J-076]MCJ2015707.1 cellulose biosynthesis protein BcsS [Methylobacterium sp. J-076]